MNDKDLITEVDAALDRDIDCDALDSGMVGGGIDTMDVFEMYYQAAIQVNNLAV